MTDQALDIRVKSAVTAVTRGMRYVFDFGAICVAFPAKPGKLPQEDRTANLGLIWPETRRGSLRGIYPPLRRMPASRLSGRRPTPAPDFRRFCEALPHTP